MKSALVRTLGAVWRSTSSLLALLLIAAALVGGIWIGRSMGPSQEAAPSAPGASVDQASAPAEYTCSMHPSVRSEDPDAKCPICFMDLVLVESDDGGGADGGERRLVMTESARALADIRTTPVVRAFPTAKVRLVGKVDYDETRLAQIAAYFPGRLERLYVDYTGVSVRKGDHLADIYSPELLAAQEELRQAIEAMESAPANSELVRTTTRETVRAARDKLRLWGLTDEQIAEIERSETLLEQFTIYSPIGGVVIHRRAMEGAYVETGDPIYTVADLSQLWIRLEAYESQLPWLRYGQRVTFTTDSLPGETFEGRISFIDPVVSERKRTVSVRLNVENDDRRLKPGMFVRATVRAEVATKGVVIDPALEGKWISPMHPEIVKDEPGPCDVCGMPLVPAEELGYVVDEENVETPLLIPDSAPLITGQRAVVYVEVPDADRPTFEGREVTLGARAGEHYIVESGLEEGERVVMNGAFKIDSALQIQAKPSMMSAGGDDGAIETGRPDAPGGESDAPASAAPDSFVRSLAPVYESYLDAQEALADDDPEVFRRAATDLTDALRQVDSSGLNVDEATVWREASQTIRSALEEGADLDLDAARQRFLRLSQATLRLESRFGHLGASSYYRAYCPMAFDFEGAEWMQRTDTVDNPYFGASMLRCGEIRTEFTPRGLRSAEEGLR